MRLISPKLPTAFFALSLAAACGDGTIEGGTDVRAPLLEVTAEPAGTNCAAGGTRISVGVDDDGNGALAQAEIDQTSFVCTPETPAPAPASLVETAQENAGVNCAAGGTRISTGVDGDGDGALDAAEIVQTRYVCTPVVDELSLADVRALLEVTEEPAGANCARGGRKLQTGIDGNDNDVLDAGEVDATEYDCTEDAFARVWFGDYFVESEEDMAALADYDVITGNLVVYTRLYDTLALPALRIVGGNLTVDTCSDDGALLETFSLPALERVGQDFWVGADCAVIPFTTVSLPQLQRVGETFDLGGSNALVTLALPQLTQARDLRLWENDLLEEVSAPLLAEVSNELAIYENPVLDTLSTPVLESAGFVVFENNAALSDCVGYRAALVALNTTGDFAWFLPNNGVACEDGEALCPSVAIPGTTGQWRSCLFDGRTWSEQRVVCQSLGSGWDLAVFQSQAEFDALVAARTAVGGTPLLEPNLWIGYHDLDTEGQWEWVTSSSFVTELDPETPDAFWNDGEPNDSESAEDCAHIWDSSNQVNDHQCEVQEYAALCRGP